jgi:hypothetical protein
MILGEMDIHILIMTQPIIAWKQTILPGTMVGHTGVMVLILKDVQTPILLMDIMWDGLETGNGWFIRCTVILRYWQMVSFGLQANPAQQNWFLRLMEKSFLKLLN